jgi:hypothetical protein
MKVQELIDLINNTERDVPLYSLYDAEDVIPREVDKVASGLNLDEHRWYSTAIDVYQCEDGFVGIRGAYQSFSEMQDWSDICFTCYAFEMEAVSSVKYIKKKK